MDCRQVRQNAPGVARERLDAHHQRLDNLMEWHTATQSTARVKFTIFEGHDRARRKRGAFCNLLSERVREPAVARRQPNQHVRIGEDQSSNP